MDYGEAPATRHCRAGGDSPPPYEVHDNSKLSDFTLSNPTTDVLIVGAGPAGLLLAALLAPALKVTVVERNLVGNTDKFWATTERRLRGHGFEHCAIAFADQLTIGSFLGNHARASGDVAVVEERLLLAEMARRAESSETKIIGHTELLGLRWENDVVVVMTTGDTHVARLVIDCSGGMSPIASTFRLHFIRGFFTVLGAHLENVELASPDLVLANVTRLGSPMLFFEVIPTSDRSAFCVVFTASARAVTFHAMESAFQSHLASNVFVHETSKSRRGEVKKGIIPIGRARRRVLPRVIAFGEAALMQPPLIGSAFNEALEYAVSVAEQIHSAFTSDSLAQMRVEYPLVKRLNDHLQWLLINSLVDSSVEKFDYIVRLVRRVDPEVLFRMYSNELSILDACRVTMQLGIGTLREPRQIFGDIRL